MLSESDLVLAARDAAASCCCESRHKVVVQRLQRCFDKVHRHVLNPPAQSKSNGDRAGSLWRYRGHSKLAQGQGWEALRCRWETLILRGFGSSSTWNSMPTNLSMQSDCDIR